MIPKDQLQFHSSPEIFKREVDFQRSNSAKTRVPSRTKKVFLLFSPQVAATDYNTGGYKNLQSCAKKGSHKAAFYFAEYIFNYFKSFLIFGFDPRRLITYLPRKSNSRFTLSPTLYLPKFV